MLNQHKNLIEPETDFLKVGDCIVDVARRDVYEPGAASPRRITVKSLQVLMMLVAHQGKVVSRVAILEWVWAGTLPSDDVLTQAIAQLRKAFGDDRDTPRYLETIAKGGYRLLAPTAWIESLEHGTKPECSGAPAQADAAVEDRHAATVPDPAPIRTAGGRRARFAITATVAVLGALLATVAILSRNTDGSIAKAPPAAIAAAKPDYQHITSMPGSESGPSLSPDGSQVVYSAYPEDDSSAGLFMQTTTPVPPRAITTNTAGVWDMNPAWSPTGRDIAFVRMGPKDRCAIMLIPASGGEPRQISACREDMDGRVGWHPDGRRLVTTLSPLDLDENGTIHVVDLGNGAWTKLAYRKGEHDVDGLAAYSPDGRWIAFRRNVSLADIWRVPAAGGEPERLTSLKTNINAIAWAPDGKSIVFGRYLDGGVSIAKLDLDTRKVIDLGLPDTAFPSIASRTGAMAFVIGQSKTSNYDVGLDERLTDKSPMKQLFPSSGADLLPSVSPDGQQVAFVSDRSGTIAVWWARIGRPESLRLIEGILPVARYGPVWSADSKRMLMIGRSGDEYGIYEIVPDAGTVRRLPVPDKAPVYAEYLPESSRLLVVGDRDAGQLGLTLYDTSTTPWRAIAARDNVALTRVDAKRGRILFTRPQEAGLWEMAYDLSNTRRISDRPGVGGGRRVLVDDGGVWLASLDEGEGKCDLQWMQLPESRDRPGACLLALAKPVGVTGVSLDRVHRRLYFSLVQGMNEDIGFMRTLPN
ncbi:biopolymer transporter Tol [Pseudoluteimonas lycopersici]|uniref:Biopolymer transporter Tol n=1 Tax=Pseudoluteimonas lycopersici TaxID=1324796 RepID=A0A516V5A7_9GAMM|nr:winged helix-turn-helix domain-containing protein [Lysobacter lycopersici]QDQ73703.1 biopolymer transporter Tol [Lysobacter lycopersici]